jgi:hypothetical protein
MFTAGQKAVLTSNKWIAQKNFYKSAFIDLWTKPHQKIPGDFVTTDRSEISSGF